MKKDIRILVVDDHQMVRDGLQRMLEQEADLTVVGQSSNGEDTLAKLDTLSPNIVLMDIKMPGVDGIKLTQQVKQKKPSCNVIMLTLYDEYLTQAMEARASGYLLKDIRREELTRAIRDVHRGEVVISGSIAAQTRLEYEERRGGKTEEAFGVTVEELQLVLPPPVEANQLMRFAGSAEEVLQSRVLQVVGSWQEGTILTIILPKVMMLTETINTLRELPEVATVEENQLNGAVNPKLLKKAEAIHRLKNRSRKTLYISLENSWSGVAS